MTTTVQRSTFEARKRALRARWTSGVITTRTFRAELFQLLEDALPLPPTKPVRRQAR